MPESIGMMPWLVERAAYDASVSLVAGRGGHDTLGHTGAPLTRRARQDVASVDGGGVCVSEEAMADAFGVGSHAIGYPKVCSTLFLFPTPVSMWHHAVTVQAA